MENKMSHELSHDRSMFFVGEKPWHGLGVEYEKPPATMGDAIVAADLDWKVEKRPLWIRGSSGKPIQVKDSEAVVRCSDDYTLGIVGNDYTPLQNRVVFDFMNPFLEKGLAVPETGGHLFGGRVIWILMKMTEAFEVVPGDEVRGFLLGTSSHNMTKAGHFRFTTIRAVCWNTLSAAWAGDAKSDYAISIRHTAKVEEQVRAASRMFERFHATTLEAKEILQKLAKTKMKRPTMDEFLADLFPYNEEAKSTTRTDNIRKSVLTLHDKNLGNIPGVQGTAWGMLNAVTEYVDHFRGVTDKMKTDRTRAETRLNSVWFGNGNDLKNEAFDKLVALV